MSQLHYLGVSNCRLTPKGVRTLFQNYRILPEVIDLSNNQLGKYGIETITDAFLSSITKLLIS